MYSNYLHVTYDALSKYNAGTINSGFPDVPPLYNSVSFSLVRQTTTKSGSHFLISRAPSHMCIQENIVSLPGSSFQSTTGLLCYYHLSGTPQEQAFKMCNVILSSSTWSDSLR